MLGAGDTQRIDVELENRPGSAAVRAEVRAYWRNGKLWKLHLTGTQSSRGWKSMFRAGWKPVFRELASQAGRGAKGIFSALRTWSDGSSSSQSRATKLFS